MKRKRILKGDLRKEVVWEIGDVESIPYRWSRWVYYDLDEEELFAIDVKGWAELELGDKTVKLAEFVSLKEFFACSQIDIISTLQIAKREIVSKEEWKEIIKRLYWEQWSRNFKFPKEIVDAIVG